MQYFKTAVRFYHAKSSLNGGFMCLDLCAFLLSPNRYKANTGTDHIEQNIFNIKAAQHGKDLDAFNENKDNKGQCSKMLEWL